MGFPLLSTTLIPPPTTSRFQSVALRTDKLEIRRVIPQAPYGSTNEGKVIAMNKNRRFQMGQPLNGPRPAPQPTQQSPLPPKVFC